MQIDPFLARVANLLSDFAPQWALCGGWSVDAWLGRKSREHADVDFAIAHDDQHAVFEYFTAGWLLNGHDVHDEEGKEPWSGRPLDFPAHIHAFSDDGLEVEFLTHQRSATDLILDQDLGVSLPLTRSISTSPWGLPTLAPEAVLFYKGAGDKIRPHDEADFRALVPHLTVPQRGWLRDALLAVRRDHLWLGELRTDG